MSSMSSGSGISSGVRPRRYSDIVLGLVEFVLKCNLGFDKSILDVFDN